MSETRNHRFELVLREFLDRPEFEGMIIDYHQRIGGQLPDVLARVLADYGGSFKDPYMLMAMIVRIARKNSVALPTIAPRLTELHEQLGRVGRSDEEKWQRISRSIERSRQAHSPGANDREDSVALVRPAPQAPRAHIGIITVREDEFTSVFARMDNRTPYRKKNYYDLSNVITPAGECVVAVCRCPEQGPGPAQATTENLISDLDPPWILMVGIAGGFPDSDFTLGDVLVANRVHDFSVTCVLEGRRPELDIRGGPFHRDVENLVAHMQAELERLPAWQTPQALRAGAPAEKIPNKATPPLFYGPPAWRTRVQKSLAAQFDTEGKKKRQRVCVAPNASSPSLMKSATLAAQWKESARSTASVEMELIGAYNAVHNQGDKHRLVGIRGISDVVGYSRRPEWTPFACHAAASFAWSLISSGLLLSILKPAQT